VTWRNPRTKTYSIFLNSLILYIYIYIYRCKIINLSHEVWRAGHLHLLEHRAYIWIMHNPQRINPNQSACTVAVDTNALHVNIPPVTITCVFLYGQPFRRKTTASGLQKMNTVIAQEDVIIIINIIINIISICIPSVLYSFAFFFAR